MNSLASALRSDKGAANAKPKRAARSPASSSAGAAEERVGDMPGAPAPSSSAAVGNVKPNASGKGEVGASLWRSLCCFGLATVRCLMPPGRACSGTSGADATLGGEGDARSGTALWEGALGYNGSKVVDDGLS